MKVLLSSPMTPYPSFREGRDNLHFNYANTTYGQGIFSLPTSMHFYGLHLMAQNIRVPTTVLEHPSRRLFTKEVQKQYDIVGITFVLPFFSCIIEMAKIVRTCTPRTRIILGGPGVQCFSHATGREAELLELVDGVCRGEGVCYLRDLLAEDTHRPIRQDLPLGAIVPFRCQFLKQQSAVLISHLGCTNSCEFCAASAFFNHRRLRLASPQELFQAVKRYLTKYAINSARILDDNFLLDPDYVREFGRLLTNDPLCRERHFTFSTFANLSSIAQYDCEELVRYGVSGILIGIESKFVDRLNPHIRNKLSGLNAKRMISDLLDHGIFVEGAMILGWDFHDPQTIREDIDYYIGLGVTFDQIVSLIPVPETRLWKQLQAEGRLLENICWDDAGFYVKWHRFKHFTHEEVWDYEAAALRKAYETWGPSYLRYFDVHLRGYRKFRASNDPQLRSVAEAHRQECGFVPRADELPAVCAE